MAPPAAKGNGNGTGLLTSEGRFREGSTIVTSDDLWVDPIRESQTLITPEALH